MFWLKKVFLCKLGLIFFLSRQANTLLQHICKAGNGHVPKPAKSESHISSTSKKGKNKNKGTSGPYSSIETTSSAGVSASSEEKLARYVLY